VLWLSSAVAAGALVRYWHLTYASPHTDEAFTFALSSLPVPQLVAAVAATDFHPPLFYLVTHAMMMTFPKPQWEYRTITALCGCLTVVATYGVSRRIFGPPAAGVAATAVALFPALVQYDRIYRMYAVTVFLTTLSFWLLAEIEQADAARRRWLVVAYTLVVIALPYTDYLGALAVAVQAVYSVTRWRRLKVVAIAIGIAALAFTPWLGPLREQLPLGGLVLSRPGLDIGLLATFQGAFAAGSPPSWSAWPGGELVPLLSVIALTAVGMRIGRATVMPWWLSLLWIQVLGSIALGKNLAYFPRYLLIDVPPLCVALGGLVGLLWSSRRQLIGAALGVAITSFLGVTLGNVLLDPYYQFPDWYALNAVMLPAEQPHDAVILDAGYERLAVQDLTAFRSREVLTFMNPGDFPALLRWIEKHPERRIWYVQHQHFYFDPQRRIAGALGARRRALLAQTWPRRWPVDDVSVVLFDKVPMTIR